MTKNFTTDDQRDTQHLISLRQSTHSFSLDSIICIFSIAKVNGAYIGYQGTDYSAFSVEAGILDKMFVIPFLSMWTADNEIATDTVM